MPVHDSCLSLYIQEFFPFARARFDVLLIYSIMRCYLGTLFVCLFLTLTQGHDQEDSQAGLLPYCFSFATLFANLTNIGQLLWQHPLYCCAYLWAKLSI